MLCILLLLLELVPNGMDGPALDERDGIVVLFPRASNLLPNELWKGNAAPMREARFHTLIQSAGDNCKYSVPAHPRDDHTLRAAS